MNINCIPIHTAFPLGDKTVLHYWYFHTVCAGEILLWRFLLTLFSSCKSNKKTWWFTKGEWAHKEQQWRQQTAISPSPSVLNIKLHELHNTRREGTTRSCHDIGGNWVMVSSSYESFHHICLICHFYTEFITGYVLLYQLQCWIQNMAYPSTEHTLIRSHSFCFYGY